MHDHRSHGGRIAITCGSTRIHRRQATKVGVQIQLALARRYWSAVQSRWVLSFDNIISGVCATSTCSKGFRSESSRLGRHKCILVMYTNLPTFRSHYCTERWVDRAMQATRTPQLSDPLKNSACLESSADTVPGLVTFVVGLPASPASVPDAWLLSRHIAGRGSKTGTKSCRDLANSAES